jgi:hypothetical protein
MYSARAVIDRALSRDIDDIGLQNVIKGIVGRKKLQLSIKLSEEESKEISDFAGDNGLTVDEFSARLSSAITDSVVRRSILALKDHILADDTLDTVLDEDYDNIVSGVHAKVMEDLDQIAKSCLDAQIRSLLDEMEE